MKYLKSYNESIKDFLKPKSEEEILNNFKGMDYMTSLKNASEYGVLSIVKKIVEKENLKSDDNILLISLSISVFYEHLDIIKYLVNEVGVNPFISKNIRDPYTFEVYKSAFETAVNCNYYYMINMFLDDPRANDYILPERIKYYRILSNDTNESIKHVLKPKNQEEIEQAWKSLDNMTNSQKLFYIFENGIDRVIPVDKLKELMNKCEPKQQIECIYDYNRKDIFTEDEIKIILSKASEFDQISLIDTYGLRNRIVNDEYIKQLVYKSSKKPYIQLDTIYQIFKDELDGIFKKDDIRYIISKCKTDQEKVMCIGEHNLNEFFEDFEITRFIKNINGDYEKLNHVYAYGFQDYLTDDEILEIFNKLTEEEKDEIIKYYKLTL